LIYMQLALPSACGTASELYTWKADFSRWRNQKVEPKMADFEGILSTETKFLFVFLQLVLLESSWNKEKFRFGRKISPSGKPPLPARPNLFFILSWREVMGRDSWGLLEQKRKWTSFISCKPDFLHLLDLSTAFSYCIYVSKSVFFVANSTTKFKLFCLFLNKTVFL
jgi:hypothetical protein